MTTKTQEARRNVLKAGAVALGAALLPRTASASAKPGDALEALRVAHRRDLESFAEELRPRFESGELRASRSPEDDDKDNTPWDVIEALCAKRFGLVVTESGDGFGGRNYEGDVERAYLLLAVSPHAECTIDAQVHPAYHAQEALTWDVIALARSRGWYTPTPDETEDPALDIACEDCGCGMHFHGDGKTSKAGCQVHGCKCTARHTPHVPGWVS